MGWTTEIIEDADHVSNTAYKSGTKFRVERLQKLRDKIQVQNDRAAGKKTDAENAVTLLTAEIIVLTAEVVEIDAGLATFP